MYYRKTSFFHKILFKKKDHFFLGYILVLLEGPRGVISVYFYVLCNTWFCLMIFSRQADVRVYSATSIVMSSCYHLRRVLFYPIASCRLLYALLQNKKYAIMLYFVFGCYIIFRVTWFGCGVWRRVHDTDFFLGLVVVVMNKWNGDFLWRRRSSGV